jgi:hypothetical protein
VAQAVPPAQVPVVLAVLLRSLPTFCQRADRPAKLTLTFPRFSSQRTATCNRLGCQSMRGLGSPNSRLDCPGTNRHLGNRAGASNADKGAAVAAGAVKWGPRERSKYVIDQRNRGSG